MGKRGTKMRGFYTGSLTCKYFNSVFKFEIAISDQLRRERNYLDDQVYHRLISCSPEYQFLPNRLFESQGRPIALSLSLVPPCRSNKYHYL